MELSESRTNKIVLPDAEKTVRIQVQIYKKTETFMGIIVFIFSLHPEDIFFRRIPRIKTVRRTGKISDMNYSAKRGRERKTGFRTLPLTDSAWGKRYSLSSSVRCCILIRSTIIWAMISASSQQAGSGNRKTAFSILSCISFPPCGSSFRAR